MLRPRAQFAARAGADAVALGLALRLAFELRRLVADGDVGVHDSSIVLGLAALPLWLAIFSRYRLFSAQVTASRLEEFKAIAHGVGASVVVTAGLTYLLGFRPARGWLAMTAIVAVPILALERELVRSAITRLRQRGCLLRPVLVLGEGLEARTIGAALEGNPALGYRVLGYVGAGDAVRQDADHITGTGEVDALPLLGELDHIGALAELHGASSVIIASTDITPKWANRIARELTAVGIDVEVTLSLRDLDTRRLLPRRLGRFSVVHVEPVRLGWRTAAKRGFDVVVSAALLVLLAPILALAGLVIKATSAGPVLFRQERVGKDGRRFPVFKLRTMVAGAEALIIDLVDHNEADGPLFKLQDDPRVTKVGRVLRRSSFDEVPQLWNVLRGEMSLVGPRPALAHEMGAWPPELHQRLRVKPGLTGMWQVGGRSNLSFDDYVRLDLYYVDNWCLLTDMLILFQTVPVVLFRRGSY